MVTYNPDGEAAIAVTFADPASAKDLPSTMSARLASKLESLALLIAKTVAFNRYGASLRVTTGYVHPPDGVDADTVSYHHEGRALTFELICTKGNTIECKRKALNGELARLAHNAGFDWVTLVDANTVCVPFCGVAFPAILALLFVLDVVYASHQQLQSASTLSYLLLTTS